MSSRKWYAAALLLSLAAITFEAGAKWLAAEGAATVASGGEGVAGAAQDSDLCSLIGLCLAVAAAACLWRSIAVEKPKWASIPVTALLAYALFSLLMV